MTTVMGETSAGGLHESCAEVDVGTVVVVVCTGTVVVVVWTGTVVVVVDRFGLADAGGAWLSVKRTGSRLTHTAVNFVGRRLCISRAIGGVRSGLEGSGAGTP